MTKQVFGIGITELTTLMSRRTLYCSMYANGEFSICTEFDDVEGNIVYPQTKHTFNKNGKCEICGANKETYDKEDGLENHAYSFIHQDLKEVFGDMKFDVIVGNPPYQLNIGNEGGNSFKASSIYHLFVEKAIQLNPKYITMIIPSRWMTRSVSGIPEEWIDGMSSDRRIKEIHDFEDSNEVFSGVNIGGGVNYFLWAENHNDDCEFTSYRKSMATTYKGPLNTLNSGITIRNTRAIPILEKVVNIEDNYLKQEDKNFSSIVSPKDFFCSEGKFTSSWNKYSKVKTKSKNVKYYISSTLNDNDIGWVNIDEIKRNNATIPLHKVYIAAAGSFNIGSAYLGIPRYGEPNSICSQTYLVIGYDEIKHNFTKKQCENIISYIKTKFFRFMVSIKKKTQNGPRGVYQFVPLQDFSKPWTDEELYKKYKLTDEEIAYIEDNIAPME